MPASWPTITTNISLTRVTTNQGDPYAELRVEDRESGMRLVTIRLDATEFFSFISGSYTITEAKIPPAQILPRVGKLRQHETIPHPPEFTHQTGRTPSAAMTTFAEMARMDGGWDVTSWTRHNFGWKLTGIRWVDRPPSAPA